jgi:predicted nuclease of predicted toxin-antitoxin system
MTRDLDFKKILSFTHDLKPSIVHIRKEKIKAEQVIDFLVFALLKNKEELEKGAVLTIDTKKFRVRLLPL